MRLFPPLRSLVLLGFALGSADLQGEDGLALLRGGDKELVGGATTVFDDTANAFSLPIRNLSEEHRAAFFVGNSFFKKNWVMSTASTSARDGLGPLFNARSCSSCHFRDGRGRPPEDGEPMSTMLLRISLPGRSAHGAPRPHEVYGDQIQGFSTGQLPAEASVLVHYQVSEGHYADGETYKLRRPVYSLADLGYGPVGTNLLVSGRVAPAVLGLGLLEAVEDQALRKLEDPEGRRSSDGISGRLNQVWSLELSRMVIGRFGWKAEQPTVRQQVAAAFLGDMGLTTSLFERPNQTSQQQLLDQGFSESGPEVSDRILADVVTYSKTLAVPARRKPNDPVVLRGERLFHQIGCAQCHVPSLQTGASAGMPELGGQTIYPYTDLLLHDMGEGLADGRPTFEASGNEWRTPPLWGLGLLSKVNGHTFLLHDGRARGIAEALLWHGGEAQSVRERFVQLPKEDRAALLTFIESL